MPQEEKSRRLLQGNTIIYPFTKQENIIGLQKTITDKLPIVSSSTPTTDYVDKQVWLDTSGESLSVQTRNIASGIIENNYGNDNDIVENNYESEN